MTYKLVLLETASADITDAFEWYQMQSEFAAAYLVERLEEAFQRITETPLIYQKVHREFRQVVLTPFPYALIYSINKNEITVFKLWHTSRNPRKKYK